MLDQQSLGVCVSCGRTTEPPEGAVLRWSQCSAVEEATGSSSAAGAEGGLVKDLLFLAGKMHRIQNRTLCFSFVSVKIVALVCAMLFPWINVQLKA